MNEDKRRFTPEGERNTAVADRLEDAKFDLVPRHEWVLIREMRQTEQQTQHGVVIPGEDFFLNQNKSPKHTYATVLAKGDKVKPDLKVGDVVLVTKFSMDIEGADQIIGSTDVRLVRDEEVYCRVVRCA